MAEILKSRNPELNYNLACTKMLRLLRLGNFRKKNVRIQPRDRNKPEFIQLRKQYAK
jgi:hypothetical protein